MRGQSTFFPARGIVGLLLYQIDLIQINYLFLSIQSSVVLIQSDVTRTKHHLTMIMSEPVHSKIILHLLMFFFSSLKLCGTSNGLIFQVCSQASRSDRHSMRLLLSCFLFVTGHNCIQGISCLGFLPGSKVTDNAVTSLSDAIMCNASLPPPARRNKDTQVSFCRAHYPSPRALFMDR